mgnify:CR=1 FL=1
MNGQPDQPDTEQGQVEPETAEPAVAEQSAEATDPGSKLEDLQRKADENWDRYLRAAAEVENILGFPDQFMPSAEVVTLEQNYRSTQPILDTANLLIAESERQYRKSLFTERRGGARPGYVTVEDGDAEAEFVVESVLANREQGMRLMDQAVLFRGSHHSDRLELELAPGFTCITGETGAGKSILVGALGLLSGNRADSSAVRQGCQKAELVAGFELDAGDSALAWLREAELDDGSDCLIRRVLHANGRSRAWVNGTPVTLQQLAELGSRLVEIHGQNEHLRLTRRSEAFRLLDSANEQALAETRAHYFAWQELEREKQALLSRDALTPGDLDLLGYQLEAMEHLENAIRLLQPPQQQQMKWGSWVFWGWRTIPTSSAPPSSPTG